MKPFLPERLLFFVCLIDFASRVDFRLQYSIFPSRARGRPRPRERGNHKRSAVVG